ncbi:MAG: FAD-dependent oxidoreductase [Rhodothermales bacterium]|nr:FAD-dependent oxidoreductase [Rhodothermales bacterium]
MYQERIAIVGGVAAGPAAAAQARRVNPSADIWMFEAGANISYGACEMPYVLSGLIETIDELVVNTAAEFSRSRNINVRTGHRITAVHAATRTLTIEDSADGRTWDERFDKLVLATGARARRLAVAGEDSTGVFLFRTLDDLRQVTKMLNQRPAKHAVVAGGGYVGVEVAESLSKAGVRVSIVHRGSHILDSYVGSAHGEIIHNELSRHGVTVRKDSISRIEADATGHVKAVQTVGGELIGCDLVVVAVGVDPHSTLALDAGIRLGVSGGIRVDEHMRTSASGIWACGDCIEVERIVDGAMIHSPLAPTAYRTARVAGSNAARRGRGKPARFHGVTPASAVKVFDLEVAAVGIRRNEAEAAGLDIVSNKIVAGSRAGMYPGSRDISIELVGMRRGGRLIGAELVGGEGAALRANVLALAIRQRLTVSQIKEVDLIYAPPFAPSIDPIIVAARELEKLLI